jgi:hypothetical protein
MTYTTTLRVVKNDKGVNEWIMKRCDKNPSLIRIVCVYKFPTVPTKAENLPIGTEYKTILKIPIIPTI